MYLNIQRHVNAIMLKNGFATFLATYLKLLCRLCYTFKVHNGIGILCYHMSYHFGDHVHT